MNMEWYETAVPTTVAEAPLTFAWEGPDKHIGPVERETPLLVKLKNKTTNGTTALAAATATWGFLRFAHHLELAPYLKFAEAVFLQMPAFRDDDVLQASRLQPFRTNPLPCQRSSACGAY